MTARQLFITLTLTLLGLSALAKAGVDSIVTHGGYITTLLALAGCIALIAGYGWLIDFFSLWNDRNGSDQSPAAGTGTVQRRHHRPVGYFHHSNLD